MSRSFTDWKEDFLAHYGVPGMRKGVRKDEQYKATRKRIEEAQARNARSAALSPTGKLPPAVRTTEVGYQKDRNFMEKHGIPSAYPTKYNRITTTKPKEQTFEDRLKKDKNDRLNPQSIINKNRGNQKNLKRSK